MAKKKKTQEYIQRIHELCDAAFELDHGPAQIVLLEEAVQIADAHNDVDLGYEVRQYLIDAATFGGSPDISLVAFAWCVARYDEDPDSFDPEPLYWRYKWIATAAPKFPTISRAQIEQLLDDMHQRYVAAGIGLHPFYQTRRNVHVYMGNIPAAQQDHEHVLRHERNFMSDCIACEQDSVVRLCLEVGDFAQAEAAGKPIFEKRLKCAEVPHRTYAMFLLPLLENGHPELAKTYHRSGLRLSPTRFPPGSRLSYPLPGDYRQPPRCRSPHPTVSANLCGQPLPSLAFRLRARSGFCLPASRSGFSRLTPALAPACSLARGSRSPGLSCPRPTLSHSG